MKIVKDSGKTHLLTDNQLNDVLNAGGIIGAYTVINDILEYVDSVEYDIDILTVEKAVEVIHQYLRNLDVPAIIRNND